MGIVARFNEAFGIRVHDYFGAVEPAELFALANFYQTSPGLVRTDVVSVVDQNATGHAVLAKHLISMRERFRGLHKTSDFLLLRRSAWVCPNVSAWSLLEEFLHERHSHDGQGSEVCLVATLPEASCLYEPDEMAALRSGEGFRIIFSSDQIRAR